MAFQPGDPEELIELTDLLDEGSSGAVFQGVFGGVGGAGKACAVKVIPGLEDATLLQEITHEIQLLRDVSSNGLFVQLFGAWEKEQHAWVCLELCEVGSVIDLCQICQTNLELSELRQLARQVLLALDFLHSDLHVVHRDIKGKNILLTAQGQVKLTDLGIAVRMLPATANEVVEPAGSPHWMAPELVRDKLTCAANDVWSLGITLIELFEGEPPHCEVLDPIEVLNVIHDHPAPRLKPTPINNNINMAQLERFLARLLTRPSDQRPSAKELLEDDFLLQKDGDGDNDNVMLKLCTRALPVITAYRHYQKTGEVLVVDQQPTTPKQPEQAPRLSKHQSLVNLHARLMAEAELNSTKDDEEEETAAGVVKFSEADLDLVVASAPAVDKPAPREAVSSLVRVPVAPQPAREAISSLVRVPLHSVEPAAAAAPPSSSSSSDVTFEESIRQLTQDRNRKHPKSIRNMQQLQSQHKLEGGADGAAAKATAPVPAAAVGGKRAARKTTALRIIKSMISMGESSSSSTAAAKKKASALV